MEMNLEYKCVVWVRVRFDSEKQEQIIEELKKGSEPLDIIDLFPNNFKDSEHIIESEEFLPVERNNNQSTIELYNDEGKLLFSNETIDKK
jgi:hypothetical protein